MIKILELFGGIGACSKALERLGIDYEIADYVEIDKYAVGSFNAMHNTNFEPQDICKWDKNIDVDLIMHGSPCQDFSIAGKQAGGDKDSGTRSSLMYETLRIIEKIKPKYVIWENVKNVVSKKHKHNFDNYCNKMSELGYNSYAKILNAKDYGIPQNRERVFTISIKKEIDKGYIFPTPIPLKLKLKDMLEDNVDRKYYLSEDAMNKIKYKFNEENVILGGMQEHQSIKKDGICTTLTSSMGTGGGYIPMIAEKNKRIKELQKYIEKYEETDEDDILKKGKIKYEMFEKFGTNRKCFRCGNQLLISDLPSYEYLCLECDENMYYFETMPYYIENDAEQDYDVATRLDVIGGIGKKQSNNGSQWFQQDRIYNNNISLSLSTCANPYYQDNNLQIRKITPKESWKLMGFDDEDFEKVKATGISDTQLYKQAGNSIVVNVLEAILKEVIS